jgi:excinuclease ABC subunit B
MRAAAAELEFEEAATLRDEIRRLENQELELPPARGGGSFSDRMRRADAQSKSRRGKGKRKGRR